jgi:hypothetical protein
MVLDIFEFLLSRYILFIWLLLVAGILNSRFPKDLHFIAMTINLTIIAYNTLLNNMDKYKVKPKFYVINFDNPRKSHRCNPIAPE